MIHDLIVSHKSGITRHLTDRCPDDADHPKAPVGDDPSHKSLCGKWFGAEHTLAIKKSDLGVSERGKAKKKKRGSPCVACRGTKMARSQRYILSRIKKPKWMSPTNNFIKFRGLGSVTLQQQIYTAQVSKFVTFKDSLLFETSPISPDSYPLLKCSRNPPNDLSWYQARDFIVDIDDGELRYQEVIPRSKDSDLCEEVDDGIDYYYLLKYQVQLSKIDTMLLEGALQYVGEAV